MYAVPFFRSGVSNVALNVSLAPFYVGGHLFTVQKLVPLVVGTYFIQTSEDKVTWSDAISAASTLWHLLGPETSSGAEGSGHTGRWARITLAADAGGAKQFHFACAVLMSKKRPKKLVVV